MIKVFKIICFFILITNVCCAQEKQVVFLSSNGVNVDSIALLSINKKDTIVLIPEKDDYFNKYLIAEEEKDTEKTYVIRYKSYYYLIEKLNSIAKSIVFFYNPNATNDCYIVSKIFGDAHQTLNLFDMLSKGCKDFHYIEIYNKFPVENKEPIIMLRR
jgi:hypothetical protein